MANLESVGKFLLLLGAVLMLTGVLLVLAPRVPFVGRLPGDILIHQGRFTLYAPLATSLLVSLALSILLTLLFRLFRG